MYICKCTKCKAIVTAEYEQGDEVEQQKARDMLAKFVLGKQNVEDSNRS